jgi:hypothetical protein
MRAVLEKLPKSEFETLLGKASAILRGFTGAESVVLREAGTAALRDERLVRVAYALHTETDGGQAAVEVARAIVAAGTAGRVPG